MGRCLRELFQLVALATELLFLSLLVRKPPDTIIFADGFALRIAVFDEVLQLLIRSLPSLVELVCNFSSGDWLGPCP